MSENNECTNNGDDLAVMEGSTLHGATTVGSPQYDLLQSPVMQVNGCHYYGPPSNWPYDIPPNGTELFVKPIPTSYEERKFVDLFQRLGQLYQIRIMLDYCNIHRRFAYVRYTTVADAAAARKVLKHHITPNGQVLCVMASFEKSKLFLNNLPKNKQKDELEIFFRQVFPSMLQFYAPQNPSKQTENKGFAFIQFADHSVAMEAKKRVTPGIIRHWNREISVNWAKTEKFQPEESTADGYEGILRMKCYANFWMPPIFIFGRVNQHECVQCVCVIIKSEKRQHIYLFEVSFKEVADIKWKVCQALVKIIDIMASLTDCCLLFKLDNRSLRLVGAISDLTHPTLQLAKDSDSSGCISWNDIIDICNVANMLSEFSFDTLAGIYHQSMERNQLFLGFENMMQWELVFGCLHPAFRGCMEVVDNIDNREIILILCSIRTYTNYNLGLENEPGQIATTIPLAEGYLKTRPIYSQLRDDSHLLPDRQLSCICFGYYPYAFYGNFMHPTNVLPVNIPPTTPAPPENLNLYHPPRVTETANLGYGFLPPPPSYIVPVMSNVFVPSPDFPRFFFTPPNNAV